MDYTKIYVNGVWVEPNTKEFIDVENPATKENFAKIPDSDEVDVNKAVDAADEAFKTYQYSSMDDRIKYANQLIEELEKRVDEMAEIIVKELGCGFEFAKKTQVESYIKDAKNYINLMKNYEFEEIHDGFTVRKEPYGVIGALTPWNFPLGQITKKLFPAILTGNTIVLKPSKQTPLVAYHLTEAIHTTDLPKGVFNMVPGSGSHVGDLIGKNEKVRLLSFTGSTEGGVQVGKLAMEDVKSVTLELGGKSPSVVLKGADLELAVDTTLNRIYNNTGQSCSALSRLVIPTSLKDEVEELIKKKTPEFKFGDPADPDTIIGPLSSKKQFDKVKGYIEKGLAEGAKLLIGEVPEDDSKGYYVGPTVFTNVKNHMEIAQNEIFGPVLSIISYDNVEEAVEIANDVVFGLAAAVFGHEREAREVANQIKAGSIIVNDGSSGLGAPFGGFKHSGIGREGGIYGIEEFLQEKALFE